jgi:hypothetical protein
MIRVICESVGNGELNEKLKLSLDDVDRLFGGDMNLMVEAWARIRDLSFPKLFPEEKAGQQPNPPPADQGASTG